MHPTVEKALSLDVEGFFVYCEFLCYSLSTIPDSSQAE